ncbi:MAG TPA: hypothetical protein VHP56_07205 [Solirubrobacterales bacterium]|nr:hypothetical protein [Solirubrobacterales bacterium]
MTSGAWQPLPDPVAEATRIGKAAAERGLPLRVLGGVAVAILCPSARSAPLSREYADIDLATTGSHRQGVVELMDALGYAGDREFNTLHGHRRLFFWDEGNGRQVDVFVDEANLCHRIDLRRRIELAPLTVSLADLAVLKLQVVETNEKDYLDICAIFADHRLTADESGVNSAYIAQLCASDWGLWRTLEMVAERCQRFALALPEFDAGELVAERLQMLRSEFASTPKTRRWKLRARVGEKKRWYEIPEEVH